VIPPEHHLQRTGQQIAMSSGTFLQPGLLLAQLGPDWSSLLRLARPTGPSQARSRLGPTALQPAAAAAAAVVVAALQAAAASLLWLAGPTGPSQARSRLGPSALQQQRRRRQPQQRQQRTPALLGRRWNARGRARQSRRKLEAWHTTLHQVCLRRELVPS
jgi:hypothetical protein